MLAEPTIDQEWKMIQHAWQAMAGYIDQLAARALAYEYTSHQIQALIRLAEESITFILKSQKGDIIDGIWIAERDALVEAAFKLLSDFSFPMEERYENIRECFADYSAH